MEVPGTDAKYEDRTLIRPSGAQRYAVTRKQLVGVLILGALISFSLMNNFEKKILINISFSTQSTKQKDVAAAVTENKKDAEAAVIISKVEAKKRAEEYAVVNVTSSGIHVDDGGNNKSKDVHAHSIKRQRPHPPKGSTCIYFNHFPKSGGTSVYGFLEHISKQLNYSMFPWYNWEPPDKPNGYSGERWPLLNRTYNKNAINAGHQPPHQFIRLAKQQACYIFTVLREPIDRSISFFYFKRSWYKDWDDFIEKGSSTQSMTVHYSLEGCVGRQCNCTVNKENGLDCNTDFKLEFPYNVDAANQVARQFLLDHDLVCFQDNLDSCSTKLKELIGHPSLSGEIKNLNVGKKRGNSTVSGEVNLDRFKGTLVENDIILYNWAKKVFLPDVAAVVTQN